MTAVWPLVIRLGAIALGFLVSVIYIPGWTGAAIPTGYLFLMIVLPVLLFFIEIPVTRFHVIGSLFLLYVCVSLSWSLNFHIAFFILLQVLLTGMIFCLGSAIKDLTDILKGVALGLAVSAVICILQWYKLDALSYTNYGYPAGLFVNPNLLCEFSAVMLVSLIVFKLWWWIPVTLPGLFIVHSRAALLGLFVCFLIWLWRFKFLFTLVVLLGIAFAACSYSMDDLNFKSTSIIERLDMWADTIRGLSLLGHGVGSFEIMFPKYAVNVDAAQTILKYAHNDLLQLFFEFGIAALIPLVLFFQIVKIKNDQKYILYTIGIISLFSYPLHVPVIMFIGFLVAGNIVRSNAASFEFGANRGQLLFKRI